MKEQGVVTAVKGNRATVKVDKKDQCSKCGMCLFPQNASSVNFDSINTVNAKVGDQVIIESKKEANLLGVILAFLVPLILIGLAVLINWLFIGKEIYVLVISLPSIAVWYVILAFIDKKIKKFSAYRTEITQIIIKSKGEIK